MKRTDLQLIAIFGLFLILIIASVVVMFRLHFFDVTGTQASGQVVAAALALAGVLFTAFITIAGYLLKYSIDERNLQLKHDAEKRFTLESDRNSALQVEAERRLKSEAAIHAVQLLSTSSGGEVPKTQRAGALFALSHLGVHELALSLSHQMLVRNEIDAEPAAWIFSKALESADSDIQYWASVYTAINASRFAREDGSPFPQSPFRHGWNVKLNVEARWNMAHAVVMYILGRRRDEWAQGILRSNVLWLVAIFLAESDSVLKDSVAACLVHLLPVFPEASAFALPDRDVIIDKVKTEVTKATSAVDGRAPTVGPDFSRLAGQLEEWMKAPRAAVATQTKKQ